ncbi:glycerate kinase type-2 family protein [Desulfovibrio sp.]
MPEVSPRDQLRQIFSAALQRIDPYRMLLDHVRVEGGRLLVEMENERHEVDLSAFRRILVLGAGKASARMGRAIEEILGDRVSGGCIVTKYGHAEPLERIEVLEAGHPVPDENGVRAARKIADLADQAEADTLVVTLISGGGSALLPSPLEIETDGERIALTLADKQQATRELLACGADIGEINCLRKHLSGLKGGRLLQRLSPARSCNFILSDVVGDHLDTIASGITAHDRSTFAQAAAVIDKYGLDARVSPKIMHVLRLGLAGRIPDTVKPGDPALDLARNILIGTNHAAMLAACETAASLGYNVAPLTCMLTGEAREAAKFLSGIAQDVRRREMLVKRPACVILGGETVVTLFGEGKGGRNQEMALAFLAQMDLDEERGRGIHFLSASTDGSDGPTDAAGAFASTDLLERAKSAGLSIADSLRNNDSYHFFERIDGLFKTGPTMTNVCDLHILLVP